MDRVQPGRILLLFAPAAALLALPPAWAQDAAAPQGFAGLFAGHFWLGLAVVFFGGMALNLTPCVYPMIPVTVALFTAQGKGTVRRTAILAGAYVAGIALSYAALGLVAAKTGALFGSWLRHPAVLLFVAGVIILLALSLFGLYELRPPARFTQRFGRASSGVGGALAMGLVVGIVAAPCVGPFLLGLLLLVSQMANPAAGFAIFFVLGLGMGAPYLALALAADRVVRLPKGGAWLVWIKQWLGVALLGVALWLIRPLLPDRAAAAAVAALLLGAGVALGFLVRLAGSRRFLWTRRAAGIACLAAALALLWPRTQPRPGPTWVPYTEAALEAAQRERRPVVVDVYADWCVPCVEMDHATFRHPDVVAALGSVITLRVDATRDVTPDAQALLQRHRVYGAPTVLFFDRTGRERQELRLTGFATPEEFLARVRRIAG